LTLACALAGSAYAQFVQQGKKLAGTGESGNAEQGYSVALSADGNTAIVGGSGDNSGAGPDRKPVVARYSRPGRGADGPVL